MQRILVTGAAGRIGRHFCPTVVGKYWMRLADRDFGDVETSFADDCMTFDLTDTQTCRAACEGIDTVVHLGGRGITTDGILRITAREQYPGSIQYLPAQRLTPVANA